MVLMAMAATHAFAGVLTVLNSPPIGADILLWNVLGGGSLSVPTGTVVTTNDGNTVTFGIWNLGHGLSLQQGLGWDGNFPNGDYLLYNGGYGPITLTFASPVSFVGFQIEAGSWGSFSSQITAYNGGNSLGSSTVNGTSSGPGDGSAPFLGIQDTVAEITSIQIDGLTANGPAEDFAIDTVYLSAPSTPTPEPASLACIGTGLGALALLARKLRKNRA
jgi:hypothetical protein